jgi:Rab-GTPase-TBC domain
MFYCTFHSLYLFIQASSTLGLIEKDLIRLPQEHYTYHHSRKNFAHHGENVPFELSATERSTRLTELLQIYAHQNPHIGYRQGMHELSSYLLLVLEIDLYDQESQSSGGESKNPLLDPQYIAHDTYGMFLALMSQLAPAYDIKMNQGAESPMELMAQSILAKIQYTANDKALYQHLIHLHCPPELYCTRWVRLLFSREVSGWKNVLLLWDIFFDLTSKCPHLTSMSKSRYTRPGVTPPLELGNFPLMLVLEATSASMILLQRRSLLSHPEGSESDSIQRLMNIPPLQNILPLTATLLSMMRRVQQQDQHPVTKESMTMECQLGTTKRSVSLSELAQNAIATGSQSILNMLIGGGGGNNNNSSHNNQSSNVSEGQQQVSFPKRRSSHQKIQTQEGSPKTNYKDEDKSQSYGATIPDRRGQIEHLAVQINNSVVTIRNYLMDLEHGVSGMNTTPIRVPQSIWLAMEDMDRVQKELIQTMDTSPSST